MTGTTREDQHTFLIILAEFFLEWKMFQTKVVEKINTHILCSVSLKIMLFLRWCRRILYCCACYRRQYGACALRTGYLRLQITLRLCNTSCFFTAIMDTWTCLNVMLYVLCLICCVIICLNVSLIFFLRGWCFFSLLLLLLDIIM